MNIARLLLLVLCAATARAGTVVVYGGTPGGLAAAVTAARLGHTVTLVEPSRHVGGVVAGGLTRTDIGVNETVGGFAREFFRRCLKHYEDTYGVDSPQAKESNGGIYMEPHVAEEQFEGLLLDAQVTVLREFRLVSCRLDAALNITTITVANAAGETRELAAEGFVDGSYEGDLMAAAMVPYRVGREARTEYDEPSAGIRGGLPELVGKGDHRTQAYNYRLCLTEREDLKVLPTEPPNYDRNRYARLLAFVKAVNPPTFHNYILNLVPVANGKYDANNGMAWQSSDWVGASHPYPEGSWAERQRIAREHLEYVQGIVYFIQNDPEVPEALRQDARRYGLAKDEFVDNGYWPHQMYIREARRMVGLQVFREQDARTERSKPNSIGVGSYTIDCHGVQRLPHPERGETSEGGLGVRIRPYEIPYGVLCPLKHRNLLVPVCCSATHVGYATLRMEPVYMILGHASGVALHLALTGQTSVQEVPVDQLQATLKEQNAILEAPYWPEITIKVTPEGAVPVGAEVTFEVINANPKTSLAECWWDFNADGQPDATDQRVTRTFDRDSTVTAWVVGRDPNGRWSNHAWQAVTIGQGGPAEIVADDEDTTQSRSTGGWQVSHSAFGYLGQHYKHNDNDTVMGRAFRFVPQVKTAGRYRVLLTTVPHPNRATNVPVIVYHADGETPVTVDQRPERGPFPFVDLGAFRFEAGTTGSVLVRTNGADGYVVVDAARFAPTE